MKFPTPKPKKAAKMELTAMGMQLSQGVGVRATRANNKELSRGAGWKSPTLELRPKTLVLETVEDLAFRIY